MKPLAALLMIVALPLLAEPVGTKMVRSDAGGTEGNIPKWGSKTNYIEDSGFSIAEAYKTMGLWGLGDGEIVLLNQFLTLSAGLWEVNSSGECVTSTNNYYDIFWTTNALGEVITRDVP